MRPALESRLTGGRTIGHLHACRLNWLRRSAPHLERPEPVDPHRCTRAQAAAALRRSAKQCGAMLTDAFVKPRSPGEALLARELDAGVAGRRIDVLLYFCS